MHMIVRFNNIFRLSSNRNNAVLKNIIYRGYSLIEKAKMSSLRYFPNTFPPFNGILQIDKEFWKSFILDKAKICYQNQPSSCHNAEGGLYVGVAGIAYMFLHLYQSNVYTKEKDFLLTKAQGICEFCITFIEDYTRRDQTEVASFLLENSGIYALSALAYHYGGQSSLRDIYLKKFANISQVFLKTKFEFGGDELFVGRAGYLSGILWIKTVIGVYTVNSTIIQDLCNAIIKSGRSYAKRKKSPCPLMFSYYNVEYLGAAHGLSSILQMLLCFDEFITDAGAKKDIKTSVDYLLSLQTPEGNFPCAMDELGQNQRSERDELVHWCHGAPGVVYLMAKAYLMWNDPVYLQSCVKCADITYSKGLLRKGPGICHGVAGSGYVFLLLYRLTKEEQYLYKANEFAEFLLVNEFKDARTPDHPFSLFEGFAGTICFLLDLIVPEKSKFPFMNIF